MTGLAERERSDPMKSAVEKRSFSVTPTTVGKA